MRIVLLLLLLLLIVAILTTSCAKVEKHEGGGWSIVKSPSGRCYEAYKHNLTTGSLGAEVLCP